MSKVTEVSDYKSKLSAYETQKAIGDLKRAFEDNLGSALNLKRVSAPLFVDAASGVNDNLNGTERPVSFDILETKKYGEVVHSLAKWKRLALHKYGFPIGEGIYTDMNAIRRDEEMDNVHSIYVDQWDWEKVISLEDRNLDKLKSVVTKIVNSICDTADKIENVYGIKNTLKREVSFITSEELLKMYPNLTSKEREDAYTKEHRTVFVMQIGDKLSNGEKHDGRAPDYDDWALNGDILFYNDVLDRAFEVSSMGIRVSEKSLDEQLTKANADDRREFPFHKMLLEGKLPYTIGGGIGQSRLCMLLLEKAHIGEVQVSLWDDFTISECAKLGIELL